MEGCVIIGCTEEISGEVPIMNLLPSTEVSLTRQYNFNETCASNRKEVRLCVLTDQYKLA